MNMAKSYQELSTPSRLVVLVSGLAVAGLALRLLMACNAAAFPYQLDYEEGNILNAGNRILHGETPYPEPGSFPYILNPYGPIGYVLTALAVKAFGLSLYGPRLMVVLESLAVALLIAALVKRLGGVWPFGLVCRILVRLHAAGVVLDSVPARRSTGAGLRPSGPVLFARRPGVGSAIALGCVVLTKHSVAAGLATCFVTLAAQRQWKQAIEMLAVLCAVALVGFAASGGAPSFHLLWTHADPYLWTQALRGYVVALTGAFMGVGIVMYGRLLTSHGAAVPRLVWTFLGISAVVSLTGGKLASDVNHFLELTSAIAIATGLVLSRLWAVKDRVALPLTAGLILMSFGFDSPARNTAR